MTTTDFMMTAEEKALTAGMPPLVAMGYVRRRREAKMLDLEKLAAELTELTKQFRWPA